MKHTTTFLLSVLACCSHGANVYVFSSQDNTTDAQVASTLAQNGHTAFIGVPYHQFDGSQSLAGYNVVYFQSNFNWGWGDMPGPGQAALRNFVTHGGSLVTCEWTGWKMAALSFQALRPLMPVNFDGAYSGTQTETFTLDVPHPIMNSGLPSTFMMNLYSYAGTITNFQTAKPGATIFYRTMESGDFVGLAGWEYGRGRVCSFATTNGPTQLLGDGGRLLGNALHWAVARNTATPSSVETVVGEEFAGNANSLLVAGDEDYYSAFNSPDNLECSVVMGGTLSGSPIRLWFTTHSRSTRPGLSVATYFYDFPAGTYRFGGGQVASTSTENVTARAPNPAGRFRGGAGQTSAKVQWLPINDEDPAQDGWLHEIDLATWAFETY